MVCSRHVLFLMVVLSGIAFSDACLGAPFPIHCQTIFYEDFRSKMFDGFFWDAVGTNGNEPKIYPYDTELVAVLHSENSLFSRVELTLELDLSGYTSVQVALRGLARFSQYPLPDDPYYDGCDCDGISVSLDGSLWYPIRDYADFPVEFGNVSFNLDEEIAPWGLSYNETFHIRFSNYCNTDWRWEGVVIDTIRVTGFPADIFNFGHAPDPPHPTLLINDGARHQVDDAVMLGATVGSDFDGVFCPSQSATYRDGVTLPEMFVTGTSAPIEVSVPTACLLDAWFDFNRDGAWSAAEKVFDSVSLPSGVSVLSVNIPADAAVSDQSYARFRVSAAGGLSPTGEADDGEVEDYRIVIHGGAPEVDPLPAYTSGGTNTLSWQPIFPGALYEAQRSLTPDFTVVEASSDWLPETSHEFSGLVDGQTNYYRVRAGAAMPGDRTVWRQSRALQFALGEANQVTICAEDGVRLAQADLLREFVVKLDGLDNLPVPFSYGGRMDMFLMKQNVLLTEFAMYLNVPVAGEIEFVVYKGGALITDPVTRIVSVVREVKQGKGFYSSGHISLALESGIHYYFGVAGPDTYEIHAQVGASHMSCADFVARGRFFVYPAPETAVTQYSDANMFFTRFTFSPDLSYAGTGSLISPLIELSPGETWHKLAYTTECPANTGITVDILPQSGSTPITGYGNVVSGTELSGLPLQPIRLRATLTTSAGVVTPTLLDWSVSRRAGDDYMLEGPWSDTVYSTQVASTLCVTDIVRLDPEMPPTPTARFEVVFSEPVYGMDTAPPYADFRLSGMSDAVITAVACNDGDTTCVVTIEAGTFDGDARLDVVTDGPMRNATGDPLCDAFSGPSYVFDLYPPRVYEIRLLDDPVTNAPQVSFQVVFNKAVYHMALTAPFSDYALSGDATGEIISVSGSDNVYTVTVAVGEQDGALRLDVLDSGTLEDHLGRGLAETYTSGPAYQISWITFTLWLPPALAAMVGEPITLEVQAEGGVPPIEYQWYKSDDGINFVLLPEATDRLLSIMNVDWDDAGYYYCEAFNAYQSVVSPTTEITVEEHALGGDVRVVVLGLLLLLAVLFLSRTKPATR